ncbi:MAG: hypothetical protein WBF53_10440, partial [Litorimonas sp.]
MIARLSALLCSVALFAAGQAAAQTTYSAGSTTYSQPSSATYQQGAASLPELAPDRIAADVVTAFDPRTGAAEWVAPTFDPFELDAGLAGAVRLRSTQAAYDLDGQTMTGGARLEIDLYYNDAGERDFGRTRDAVFLNGEAVPILRRDSRELECSSRVTETIYVHDRYYSPGYGGLFRPAPRYRGHFGYGHRDHDYRRHWGGDRFGHDYRRGPRSRGVYHPPARQYRDYDRSRDRDRYRDRDRDRSRERARDRDRRRPAPLQSRSPAVL